MTARSRTILALAGILTLGAALRIASAGGFWIDEVFSAANAKAGPSTFVERLSIEPHSPWPIYYLLLGWWQRVFPSVEGMKALSILISLAQVLALYGLGRSLHSERAGLLAALLAAVNPLLAWYGGEIRMYGLMTLCLTGAIWAAFRARRTGRVRDGLLFALLASLAVYSHVFAVFPVLVLWLAVVVGPGRKAAWAAVGLGAATSLPVVWISLGQAGHWLDWKGGDGYVSSPMNLIAAGQSFFTGYALPLEGVSGERIAAGVLLLMLVGGLVLAAVRLRARARWWLVGLVAIAVVGPWLIQIRTKMFSPRFAIGAMPPLLLLTGIGLSTLADRRVWIVAGSFVLLGAACVWQAPGRTDWREVDALLGRERLPNERLEFDGGNVVALREWFGETFELDVEDRGLSYWWIAFRDPSMDLRVWQHRTDMFSVRYRIRCIGPGRRLVEDERPYVTYLDIRP